MKGFKLMYFSLDGKTTESAPILEFKIANKQNLRLNFMATDKLIGFITLTPREISHIMRIGFHLPVLNNPT